ncbi:MAG: Rid family hydrolase [Planctomycetota bacterium]|jgi:enamine deaminase RidA (YjgF/YER057c/UK114 family)
MTVKLDIRKVESHENAEFYILAVPEQNAPIEEQAAQMFNAITDSLNAENAHLLQERIFTHDSALQNVFDIRSQAYGSLDDGIPPTILLCDQGINGPFAGIQIHAIRSEKKPQVIKLHENPCGRLFKATGREYLTLSNISAQDPDSNTKQARKMLEKAEDALKLLNADFLNVARTWMWLGNILSWYDDFNRVRNQFFTERGVIGTPHRQYMPASTGIGLKPPGNPICAMDLVAVLEPEDSIEFLPAVGKQQCALEYGSAFSRASKAVTPAAVTVFVSGTAAIDATGATTNVENPAGQINDTIENVRAVLKDMKCSDHDVVQAFAYCKNTDVEKVFHQYKEKLSWPWLTIVCDICRPELLFEIEVTAAIRQ